MHAAGDGEVPSWWSALDRRRLAVALGSTFVAVPVIVLDNLPQHRSAQAEAEEVAVVAEPSTTTTASTLPPPSSTTVTVESTTTTTAAPTTTTTAPRPTTTAPPTTQAPTTTTTTAPPPPPTTAPPPSTTTTAPPAPTPANQESGKATWYRYRTGECAHRTLPRGTVVTVTNVANGRTATCTVTDRGPYGGGRIIDLDDETFAQLAPLSAGVIDVTISW